MERATINGFGNQVPPVREHVVIWFLHYNADVSVADSFFDFYCSIQWKNKKGVIIKNWKVHAWKWLWERHKP